MNPEEVEDPLATQVARGWPEESRPGPGSRVVVAVSGGLDSVVLLHLLRFRLELGDRAIVAHFDHRMRPGSGADAHWVEGLAAAWGLPVRVGRAERPPRDEAEARRLRYGHLWRVVADEGAALLLTAHHADDQVETILFRALRGSGVEGLAGMPRLREPGLLRPLLDVRRAEIEEYAERSHIRPRTDPTNVLTDRARNRVRHELLPALEAVHPGAHRSLLRLGRNARRVSEALEILLQPVRERVVHAESEDRITIDRTAFLAEPPPVQNVLIRSLGRNAGLRLDEAGTVAIMEFMKKGSSGGRLHFPGSGRLSREFGLVHLEWGCAGDSKAGTEAREEADVPLVLSSVSASGSTTLRVGGRGWRVIWGEPRGDTPNDAVAFDAGALVFPLTIRSWRAGDRTRSGAGSRKLKKLFGDLRIPRSERDRLPVVVDGRGVVIWIPGHHRAPIASSRPGAGDWHLEIRPDETNG